MPSHRRRFQVDLLLISHAEPFLVPIITAVTSTHPLTPSFGAPVIHINCELQILLPNFFTLPIEQRYVTIGTALSGAMPTTTTMSCFWELRQGQQTDIHLAASFLREQSRRLAAGPHQMRLSHALTNA